MPNSIHTTLRRVGVVLIVGVLGAILAGSALAENRSGLNLPPSAAIKASSANWAAKARLLDTNGRPQFDQQPSLSSIDTASANWAAKARLLDVNGQPRLDAFVPRAAINAASANWEAKAKLLDISGRPVSGVTVPRASVSTGFDRRNFGMGAGAMLGLVLLLGGIFAGVHFGRRSTVRTHPSS